MHENEIFYNKFLHEIKIFLLFLYQSRKVDTKNIFSYFIFSKVDIRHILGRLFFSKVDMTCIFCYFSFFKVDTSST